MSSRLLPDRSLLAGVLAAVTLVAAPTCALLVADGGGGPAPRFPHGVTAPRSVTAMALANPALGRRVPAGPTVAIHPGRAARSGAAHRAVAGVHSTSARRGTGSGRRHVPHVAALMPGVRGPVRAPASHSPLPAPTVAPGGPAASPVTPGVTVTAPSASAPSQPAAAPNVPDASPARVASRPTPGHDMAVAAKVGPLGVSIGADDGSARVSVEGAVVIGERAHAHRDGGGDRQGAAAQGAER